MPSPVVTFRIPDDDLQKLDELVALAGLSSRSALVLTLIRLEHDRVQGSPELKKILEQLRAVRSQIEALTPVSPA